MHTINRLFFLVVLFVASSPAWAGHSYDLEGIINRALEANWGMIDAQEGVQRAGLRIEAAESEFELKFFPVAGIGLAGEDGSSDVVFSMGVRLEKITEFGTQIELTPSVQRSDDQYRNRANLRITQPLLRGAGRDYTLSGVYSARFGERTAMRARHQREIDTVVDAVRYGYEVVRQRELLRLREESYQRLKDLAEATDIKKRMGLVDAMDLFRVRIQLAQAVEERNRSLEMYTEALDSLKIFLVLPLDEAIDVSLPMTFDRLYPDEAGMVQTALANRIELEQIRDALAEARRLSDRAGSDTLPELDIRFSLSQAGEPSSHFPGSTPDQTTWSVSLGSTTDFRRTAQKALYEESVISVGQAARRHRIAKDEIAAQVKREIRSLERLDKAITNQEEQIHQARGQLELARVKFEHGMADNFDLIDAEIALRRSQTQLVSAVIEYIVGQYRLRAVIGMLVHR